MSRQIFRRELKPRHWELDS